LDSQAEYNVMYSMHSIYLKKPPLTITDWVTSPLPGQLTFTRLLGGSSSH